MREERFQPIFAFWVSLAVLIGLIGFFFARETDEDRGEMVEVIEISVRPGDTLWSIATKIAPNVDPRVTLEWIARANRLTSTRLLPGQRLLVPRREPGFDEESMMCLRRTNDGIKTGDLNTTGHSGVQAREVVVVIDEWK